MSQNNNQHADKSSLQILCIYRYILAVHILLRAVWGRGATANRSIVASIIISNQQATITAASIAAINKVFCFFLFLIPGHLRAAARVTSYQLPDCLAEKGGFGSNMIHCNMTLCLTQQKKKKIFLTFYCSHYM